MRFLSLLVIALSAAKSVSAACSGTSGSPGLNAIIAFVTSTSTTGKFSDSLYSGGQNGLVGADNICNNDAIFGSGGPTIQTLVTRGQQGLFQAVLSNQFTDAASRFGLTFDFNNGGTPVYSGPADATWDVVDSNGNCLAANLGEFFGCNMNYDAKFRDSAGTLLNNGNIKLWTGSTCSGAKFFSFGTDSTDQQTVQQHYCSDPANPASSGNAGWEYGGSSTFQAEIGNIAEGLAAVESDWINKGTLACNNGLQLICLQAAQPAVVSGDPQFTGLQGQHFQVHGMPDEFFNLITTPDMQLNSRFAYLASGTCNYNNTECWTHPGTYVDQLGFMFPGLHIKAVAGAHAKGMIVSINDVHMDVSKVPTTHAINNDTIIIKHSTHDTLTVTTPLFTITATNSDMFFNFGVEFHDRSLLSAGSTVHHITDGASSSPYPKYPMHGLLGQTWKNARYKHGSMYQGQVDDYMIMDSQLFSSKFIYNTYTH